MPDQVPALGSSHRQLLANWVISAKISGLASVLSEFQHALSFLVGGQRCG